MKLKSKIEEFKTTFNKKLIIMRNNVNDLVETIMTYVDNHKDELVETIKKYKALLPQIEDCNIQEGQMSEDYEYNVSEPSDDEDEIDI